MNNKVVKFDAPELQVLDKSKSDKIKETFEPMADMLAKFEDAYNSLVNDANIDITKDVIKRAKRLRLDISDVRIKTGQLKDKQKEYIKLEDKAIMGVHNILVWAVKEKEDKLKEIEKHFEIQEQKRLEKLQVERAEKLSPYVEDAHERDLSKFEADEFEALLSMKKKQHEDKIAAEKQAELDRIEKEKAEAEELKRIAAENEKLKKEAIERERLAEIESDKREKAEKERKAKEEAERKKDTELKDKRNSELKPYIVFIRDYNKMLNMSEADYKKEFQEIVKCANAQWEYEREEQIKKAKEESIRLEKQREAKAKSDKLEAELKAKEDADRKANEEKEAEFQAELNKGDAAKVKDLILDLEALKSKYSFKSNANTKKYNAVGLLIDKVITYIKK